MFHFFTPPHPDCSIVIITIVMLIIAAICRERFIMQGAEWFRCTNSFSLYCNPRGCSRVLFHTQGSQASKNMIQGALVLVAKKALGGGSLGAGPASHSKASFSQTGGPEAWGALGQLGRSLPSVGRACLRTTASCRSLQSQEGFSWSGQMREEEAAEGEGVEAGEGEGSERGLGGLQRPWNRRAG